MADDSAIGAVPNQYGRTEIRGRYWTNVPPFIETGYYADEEGRNASTVLSKLVMFAGLAI